MTLTELFRLLDSKIKWIGLGLVGPAQTSMKEASVILSRRFPNCYGLKFRRHASVVSRAKSFLQFSLCTALIVVAALSDAHGQISYSLPIPLFPLVRGDNGELLAGGLNKVIVDINGDGYDDAIYHLTAQNQLYGGGVPSPIIILLNDGKGGFYDGTSDIIAGPPPKALWVRDFIVEDFNGDGRLDIFFSNTGPANPIPNPGEQNMLFLSGSDGKLHDVTATHLPQLRDWSFSSAADVDGDSDIDIWVNNGGPGTDGRVETYLMLNDGTGRFTIVAQQGSGVFQPHVGSNGRIPEQIGGSYRAFFADTDNDGDPDLIMGYNGLPINPRVTRMDEKFRDLELGRHAWRSFIRTYHFGFEVDDVSAAMPIRA